MLILKLNQFNVKIIKKVSPYQYVYLTIKKEILYLSVFKHGQGGINSNEVCHALLFIIISTFFH